MISRAPFQLFDVPAAVLGAPPDGTGRAGGQDTGLWSVSDSCQISGWHQNGADQSECVEVLSAIYLSVDGELFSLPQSSQTEHCQPFTWRRYVLKEGIVLESLSFSPDIPSFERESRLPIFLTVFRARNNTGTAIEFSFAMTLRCFWSEAILNSQFDLQHDRLSVTGSLGDIRGERRLGLSIPDFYSHGGVAQGVEPFLWPEELRDVLEEFGHSGELEPRVIQSMPAGLAAWIKTELKPNHQFEAPFAFVWHDPTLPDGMSRSYTNYLGRTRPDNAVVWLAEQAFEDFGVETATYKYWMQVIADWQATSQNIFGM